MKRFWKEKKSYSKETIINEIKDPNYDPPFVGEKLEVFTNFRHDNVPFVVHLITNKECDRAQQCLQCEMAFPREEKFV